ncbi:helix-turn-helix transcriptional regulator [Nocardia aurantia]|uniref:HTH deoR-type domain-containing protein n=1 Tax=Nocardia aurantia TaxID=2585199 RepID=A0A7K0E141_9NOCA|nr:WYL domain-containing protein [Nocardia aurantia]MQY30834.1 hypothetical protein [Nocardia aurantia]
MPKTSARLLALLSLLQARRDWPGTLLAERLAVSPRTVRRDVDRLRELGYPIAAVKGPDGGYRLGAGAELPPLLFDDDQAVAVTVALRLAATAGAGIEEAAVRALNTIRQVLPARLRHRVDALRITAVGDAATPAVDPDVLVAIGAAVHAREVLRFDYGPTGDPGEAIAPRRVEPHHLVTRDGRWYLIGWDPDRDDWRVFRADRIGLRTPNGPRFTPRDLPGGDVAAFVTGRFRGSDTPGWPCRGEVVLRRPAADVSPFVHDGLVEALGPDRCRLITGSWSWIALAAAIGRFDTDFEIVGPPELRAASATLARRHAAAAQG